MKRFLAFCATVIIGTAWIAFIVLNDSELLAVGTAFAALIFALKSVDDLKGRMSAIITLVVILTAGRYYEKLVESLGFGFVGLHVIIAITLCVVTLLFRAIVRRRARAAKEATPS